MSKRSILSLQDPGFMRPEAEGFGRTCVSKQRTQAYIYFMSFMEIHLAFWVFFGGEGYRAICMTTCAHVHMHVAAQGGLHFPSLFAQGMKLRLREVK